jgi:hypothetical protein
MVVYVKAMCNTLFWRYRSSKKAHLCIDLIEHDVQSLVLEVRLNRRHIYILARLSS